MGRLATAGARRVADEPTPITIRVGNTATVTVTSSAPIASTSDVVWSDLGDAIEVVGINISGTTAESTLRALKFSPTPKDIKVTIGGAATIVRVTFQTSVTAADFPATMPSEVEQDKEVIVRLNLTGVTIPLEAWSFPVINQGC